MPSERANQTFLARLCEQAKRYDDMVTHLKEIIKLGGELSVDERNLLSVAYTNVIGTRRVSWRNISVIEQKEGGQKHIPTIREYRCRIEDELENICRDALEELDERLIPRALTGSSKVFYQKMKGDYCRYLAEFASGEKLNAAVTSAHMAYKTAVDIARAELAPTHPLRLSLALNFSAFCHDILNALDFACDLAKEAFDDAINELDSSSEESNSDSTLIMQLLRANLALWESLDNDELELQAEGSKEEVMALA